MRDYAVVANIKAEQKGIIDDVFDKGYEQGYHDGKLDGEAEKIEKLEKQFDDEKKAEYKRGYEQGRMSTLTIKDFEEYYHKGLKHGQELRAKEAECAEACGMKRAWDVARKIVLSDADGGIPNDNIPKIYSTSYYGVMKNIPVQEAIAKLEEWEKEQEENEKVDCNNTNCKNCINHNDCDYEDEWKLRRRGIVPAPPKEKQDAPEMNVESIEVGDEVYQLDKNYTYIVTNTDDKISCFFSRTGHWGCKSISELHKTGRHFPIQEILDAMKNNSEENNDNDG